MNNPIKKIKERIKDLKGYTEFAYFMEVNKLQLKIEELNNKANKNRTEIIFLEELLKDLNSEVHAE